MFKNKPINSGQALVTLLIFITIMITVVGAAVSVIISNIDSATKFEGGQYALSSAEAGAEEAAIRLLRDPNYSGGNLLINGETVQITVTSAGSNRTVTSRVTTGAYKRAIQLQGTYTNEIFTVVSWLEIN